jgi:hypothetical protein
MGKVLVLGESLHFPNHFGTSELSLPGDVDQLI